MQECERLSFLLWASRTVERVDTVDFTLKDRPYLSALYEDESPRIVIHKPSQIGATIWAILRFLHEVGKQTRNTIYYFPTDKAISLFVQGRFNSLVRNNPKVSQMIRDTDNQTIKQIGQAFGYFMGLKGAMQKLSTPADTLFFDEVNAVENLAENIETARERLGASKNPREFYLSTPTVPDHGVTYEFDKTDKKHLATKCEHCSTWNIPAKLKFPDCIAQGFLACRKCGKALNPKKGVWVAECPGVKDASGYQLSRLIDPGYGGYPRLLESYRSARFLQNFYNSKLGLPYADAETYLTAAFILTLCSDRIMAASSQEETTAGVDVGKVLHVVISRKSTNPAYLREYVYVGEVEGEGDEIYDNLGRLFQRYGVNKFVIDANPETHNVRSLVKRNRWSGWMCYYSAAKGETKWNEDKREVHTNRTESLDASQRLLRNRLLSFPRRCPEMEELARHCEALKKSQIMDEKTNDIEYEYVASRADHFRHAINYDVMCWDAGSELDPSGGGMLVLPDDLEDSSFVLTGRY